MKRVAGILALMIVLAACQKEQDSDLLVKSASSKEDLALKDELYGRYLGTFSRDGKNTSQVSILFNRDGTYEGSSNIKNFPAICSGTFRVDGSILTVNDMCAWTADFDWTLIFDGTYTIEDRGENNVRIWRTNGTVTDEYLIGRAIK